MATLNELENEEIENAELDADGNPIEIEETAEQIAAREALENETEEDKTAREAAEALAKENEDIHPDFHDLGAKAKAKAQKRFNKITGEKYKAVQSENDTMAENRALKERLDNIEKRLSGGASTETIVETEAKPVRGEDEEDDDFIERLTDWKAKTTVNAALKANETKAEKDKLQKADADHSKNTVENFKAQSAIAMDLHEDYLEITASAPINLKSELGQEILDSKKYGAEIMYILGKDPELFAEVQALSGKELIKAFGPLEKAAAKAQSKKPKPKKIVPDPANVNRRGTNHTGTKKSLSEQSPDEYYRSQCAVKT